jgi:hypothetical protein
MHWETFKFIIDNKAKFAYDSATGQSTDLSTDPGATGINPASYLPPIIGGSKLMQALSVTAMILLVIYLLKLNLK